MSKHLTTLTILALCALTTAAAAQGPSRLHADRAFAPRAPGCEQHVDQLDRWLDLTEEQEAAIEAIGDEARDQAVELRKRQARLKNEIDGELLADEPSETKLVDLAEKLGAVRTELQVIRLKARLAVRAELTAEQRDQLVLMDGRGGRHGLHRGHRSGDRDELFRHFRHRRGSFPDAGDGQDDEDEI